MGIWVNINFQYPLLIVEDGPSDETTKTKVQKVRHDKDPSWVKGHECRA